MSAVMYVELKSWVISTGVMFVNWRTAALLVRRLSRLESAGCATEFWILPAMYLVAKQVEVASAEPTPKRCVREKKKCKTFC